ncbi:ABC transporter permease [Cellvibrio japonicus]|uniref:ABC transporter, permease protein n=1 Tax=Cellvibrio japonicus (strain Ueda107) TaxID=498211 RepID=B3PJ32_CELJU|nr:ABC transporter permease [Cellvibrio japonicus]ACE84568.1 ABC transporter, permease protein [Cellvibrio japonicus Ueda107]QEI11233.1 ABC transporter permease [Cellvibrio japonicus]QEI14807.1 ABC transporter permease [Cellvibrio japonicus]QEI18387.1 ABC transporter permease [Cellvibrio japonicus]
MDINLIENILFATVRTGTPLLLVALGAMMSERSGVLNLGQEGMILVGAACAFMAAYGAGSLGLGILAGAAAGMAVSLIFAFIALSLMSNQVATGLALTIFGTGLSAFLGAGYVGQSITGLAPVAIPLLSGIPLLGKAFFAQDALVYLSFVLFALVWGVMRYTRLGLVIRAVGENPEVAHALGYKVLRVRYLAVMFGGAMAGLAGAYLSLAYTPMWSEGIAAGRGWIALALVVFASWRSERILLGAWLFGFASILHLLLQGYGYEISPNLLAMLPYIVTILVLVLMMYRQKNQGLFAPRSLGHPFHPSK